MEKYRVTVTSFNNQGKQDKHYETCDDLIAVSRFILTFEPKRGYDPVRFAVEKEMVLI